MRLAHTAAEIVNRIDETKPMTLNDTPQGADAADKTVPLKLVPDDAPASSSGHPIRQQGLTFVTHEVELKGPFGLPHWSTILARIGLKR